jgi:GTP cyclohydrolase IA
MSDLAILDTASTARPVHTPELRLDPKSTVRLDLAAAHARAMLNALGMACEDESTKDTPERFVRALDEMTRGRWLDPCRHLAVTFPAQSARPGMITVTGIPFVAVCEHHLLPFEGRAAVAYIPAEGARIVGLSKLARLVAEYAARPQVQERLSAQVVDAITEALDVVGAACLIQSGHCCMTLRGARAHSSGMVTSQYTGVFAADPALRAEFVGYATANTYPASGVAA